MLTQKICILDVILLSRYSYILALVYTSTQLAHCCVVKRLDDLRTRNYTLPFQPQLAGGASTAVVRILMKLGGTLNKSLKPSPPLRYIYVHTYPLLGYVRTAVDFSGGHSQLIGLHGTVVLVECSYVRIIRQEGCASYEYVLVEEQLLRV